VSDEPAKIWTRSDLDLHSACSCRRVDCPQRSAGIRARCHPDAGMIVVYGAEAGQLTIACGACRTGVARIQVAWAVPS
jgi:hypothetical protein